MDFAFSDHHRDLVVDFPANEPRVPEAVPEAGISSVYLGKSQAKIFDKDSRVNITFKDVAGLAKAKQEVEIVEFLRNAAKYTKLGGKIPR